MVHRKTLFLFVISSLILIPIVVFTLAKITNPRDENPREAFKEVLAAIETEKENPIESIVEEELLNDGGDYGVVIKNLKTGENFSLNENREFQSASLYKLWIMGVAFQKISDGQLSETEILKGNLEDFDRILSEATPTPSATPSGETSDEDKQEETKEISYSAQEAIEKMITVSDNYAALLVASRAGSFAVTNFLKKYELKDSNFRQPPKTTAKDIALFFEKLYKGEIIDQNYSNKMLGILKRQTLNDRIPKYFPSKVNVSHKTGELNGFKHDAGIVYSSRGDYIIVVLSDTKDPAEASEKIANFSKDIFDYFTSL